MTIRPPSAVDARMSLGDASNADIDMSAEMATLLKNRGHYVYLRRAHDRRCGCWNEVLRESDIDCPFCTGTGWLYHDELHKARRMLVTDPGVAAMLETRAPVGLVAAATFVFWFGMDVNPGPGKRDLILEVTLSQSTGLPLQAVHIERIWNIGQVYPLRDQGGNIEFWACWVREGGLGKE